MRRSRLRESVAPVASDEHVSVFGHGVAVAVDPAVAHPDSEDHVEGVVRLALFLKLLDVLLDLASGR